MFIPADVAEPRVNSYIFIVTQNIQCCKYLSNVCCLCSPSGVVSVEGRSPLSAAEVADDVAADVAAGLAASAAVGMVPGATTVQVTLK